MSEECRPGFGRIVWAPGVTVRPRWVTGWVKGPGRVTTYYSDGTSTTEDIPTEIVFSKPAGDWTDQ